MLSKPSLVITTNLIFHDLCESCLCCLLKKHDLLICFLESLMFTTTCLFQQKTTKLHNVCSPQQRFSHWGFTCITINFLCRMQQYELLTLLVLLQVKKTIHNLCEYILMGLLFELNLDILQRLTCHFQSNENY